MVWIHGGSFMEGSGNGENDFYGPGYIMDRDVVFVTINYRLTALGNIYNILPYNVGVTVKPVSYTHLTLPTKRIV